MDSCISRKAAIDVNDVRKIVEKYLDADDCNGSDVAMDILSDIMALPSAQPEKVKCKKCRYVYYDKEFGNYWCNRKPDSFMVEEDGYCKWGK